MGRVNPPRSTVPAAHHPHRLAGFTLIELVLVLMLVAALAVTAVPRFANRTDFDERAFVDSAFAAARYAQKRAIATGCDIQIQIDGSGYALWARSGCSTGAFNQTVSHPGRPGGFAETPPAGVSIPAGTEIYFDPIGRPRDPGDNLLAAATDIAIGTFVMRVEAETGFVHAP